MAVTLYYFPLRGRAEVFRLMCAAKGIEYTVRAINKLHNPAG